MASALLKSTRIENTEETIIMNSRINEATIPSLSTDNETTSEAMTQARYAMLNELPGLIFGLMTLAWIATSLLGLV
jgi:hypothetical protein